VIIQPTATVIPNGTSSTAPFIFGEESNSDEYDTSESTRVSSPLFSTTSDIIETEPSPPFATKQDDGIKCDLKQHDTVSMEPPGSGCDTSELTRGSSPLFSTTSEVIEKGPSAPLSAKQDDGIECNLKQNNTDTMKQLGSGCDSTESTRVSSPLFSIAPDIIEKFASLQRKLSNAALVNGNLEKEIQNLKAQKEEAALKHVAEMEKYYTSATNTIHELDSEKKEVALRALSVLDECKTQQQNWEKLEHKLMTIIGTAHTEITVLQNANSEAAAKTSEMLRSERSLVRRVADLVNVVATLQQIAIMQDSELLDVKRQLLNSATTASLITSPTPTTPPSSCSNDLMEMDEIIIQAENALGTNVAPPTLEKDVVFPETDNDIEVNDHVMEEVKECRHESYASNLNTSALANYAIPNASSPFEVIRPLNASKRQWREVDNNNNENDDPVTQRAKISSHTAASKERCSPPKTFKRAGSWEEQS
ncbi:hypothetical protein HDU99_003099, partial [Rhizoclosmatium hyalinum]